METVKTEQFFCLSPQEMRIMCYLKQHGSITDTEARENLGVNRLASRVHDLKNKGINIIGVFEKGLNRFGDEVCYKRYSL